MADLILNQNPVTFDEVVVEAPKTNKDAMPPPVMAPRPGPSDWMNKYGAVCDGDYVTMRNKAWGGVTMAHSWNSDQLQANGTNVFGEQRRDGEISLSRVRMDNEYTFCIRKLVWSSEKRAWVLIKWDGWKDRAPILKTDTVCFLVPNDPRKALGTRNPPNSLANNGDYKCELVDFPVCTAADLINHTVGGVVAGFISLGFWHGGRNNVDFLNQSRCVWTFKNIDDGDRGVKFGSPVMNIRNLWTQVKQQESNIWDFVTGSPLASIVGGSINSNWNGGRNLTQAAGSGGRTVKLALTNHDRDDKSGWIIDGWYGNRYPVQRAMIPTTPPPAAPEGETPPPEEERRPIVIPNLTDQINNPPPADPGMTLDVTTGTNRHTGLEKLLDDQNPLTFWDYIAKAIYGKRWDHLTYVQQATITAGILLGTIVIADDIVKEII